MPETGKIIHCKQGMTMSIHTLLAYAMKDDAT